MLGGAVAVVENDQAQTAPTGTSPVSRTVTGWSTGVR